MRQLKQLGAIALTLGLMTTGNHFAGLIKFSGAVGTTTGNLIVILFVLGGAALGFWLSVRLGLLPRPRP